MKSKIASIFHFVFEEDRSKVDSLQEFKVHYEQNNLFVRKLILAHTRSDQVDDLVQEVFLKAWKSFEQFKRQSKFSTWIYTITMRVIWDFLKTQKDYDELDENHLKQEMKIDERIIINQGLNKLTELEREVFVLYYNMGHSFKELSNVFDKPESTIKSIVYRAKEKFIKWYQKYGNHHER